MSATANHRSDTDDRFADRGPGAEVIRGVIKRDGREAPFDRSRISHAIEMAYRAELGCPFPDPLRSAVATQIDGITDSVLAEIGRQFGERGIAEVEAVQDEVERQLMAAGAFAVARRYILYREARARRRE